MKISTIRYIVGGVGILYGAAAAYATASQGGPIDINQLIKIVLVIAVGLAVAFGPNLIYAVFARLIGDFMAKSMPKVDTSTEEDPIVSPSIFKNQGIQYVAPPVNVRTAALTPTGSEITDQKQTAKVVTTNSSLLVDLLYAANGDQGLIEQIKVLNDGLFRKSTEKVGAEK